MIKLFILLVEVEIYMKTLRIGNINSCCINGTFVFLGFIGYLVEWTFPLKLTLKIR